MQLEAPRHNRRGFLSNLLVGAALVVAFAVGRGGVSIEPLTSQPVAVVQPSARSVPTSAAAYIPQAAPAAAPVVVVPQGKYHAQPTVAPLPTEISPEVLAQGATSYALITTPPTPFPTPVCDAQHPAFITDPVRVLDEKGIPIGDVQGWSCGSRDEAVASVQQAAQQMIAAHKAQK